MSNDWIQRPIGIMGHVFDYWLLPEDPAQQVGVKRDLGFAAEHWFGSRIKAGGDNGRSFLFRTRHGFLEDKLGPYLEAARPAGMKVLVYVNAHWFSTQIPAQMFMRRVDGSLPVAYGSGSLVCPGGPFLDYALALAEDLGQYEIDGVFLDGPMTGGCWCDHCRRAYRERFGEEMPISKPTLSQRRQMEQFSADKAANFVGRFREVLRRARPDAVVYHNGSTLGSVTWANREVIKHADLLGIEGGFIGYTPLAPQFLYKTSVTTRLLECLAGGKPAVVFNDHAFKKFDYWPLPRPELDLLWAATIAGGAHSWFLLYTSNLGTQAADAAKYWNGFLEQNREALAGTKAAENVAVLWSDSTAMAAQSLGQEEDSVHGESAGAGTAGRKITCDHRGAFEAACAMLVRSAVGFRVITERELADGRLDGIAAIIAPSVVALEPAALDGLEKFVAGGGTLIADDEFAAVDELGRPYDATRLRELRGADVGDAIAAGAPNIDYFGVTDRKLGKGVGSGPLPRPARALRLANVSGKPLAMFYTPLAARYDDLPPQSDLPAIIRTPVGGGRVFYMPMNLFEHYQSFSFEPHRQIIANMVLQSVLLPVTIGGLAGRGEVLVRKSPDGRRLLVNLLNYNGSVRPFASILPLTGVRIRVSAQCAEGRNVVKARALHSGKDLPVRAVKGGWDIRLGKLGIAESVLVDLE